MLLKDLKSIINEADAPAEAPKAPEGETPATPDKSTIQKTVRAKRDVEAVKQASDGIGEEEFKVAGEVAEFLEKTLPSVYKVGNISADKGMVVINNASQYLKGEQSDEFTNVIQQYVATALGAKGMKSFNITGPFPANKDVNLVFQSVEREKGK